MKIERAEAMSVKMPLKYVFETSYGRQTERETVLVRLYSEGLCGWGEAAVSEWPDYCYETPAVSLLALEKYLFPLVSGREFSTPEELARSLSSVCGYPFSKTGIESAFLDLYCRAQGVPLHRWLGGTRPRIETGISLGIEHDQGVLFERIEWALAEGYRRIKLKIKPGHDVSTVSAVREFYPEVPLMVDANCAYSLADLDRLKFLDALHLMMIEQPLHANDLVDHADLQKRLRTHLCLDESIRHLEDLQAAVALGSCRVVNVKFGRVGGLLAGRELARESIRQGIAVWCGGQLESGVGRAHNLALNSLPEFSLPGDISASDRYWEEDIIEPEVTLSDGEIELPDLPGIGYQVIEDRVKRLTTARIKG